MLNFKFLKRASFFFVLAFALFSNNVSLAQEQSGPRDSGMAILVESAEIKTGENGIEIEAVLFNPNPSTETPLATYLLILSNIDPLVKSKDLDYTPSSLIVSAQEGEDYFSLKPNERKTVKYFLPVSQYLPAANYALSLRLMQKNGDIAGQRREIVRDFGANKKKTSQVNYEKGFLAFFQESCVILNAKGDKFEPNEGPVFNSLEQPKARCMVKNIGEEEIAVYPKIEWKEFFVYGRPSSGVKLEENLDNNLTFKKGETKLVEVSLPAAQNPQVYQALLSFKDNNGNKRSFDIAFRWTIGGSSARVEKVSLLSPAKNIYEKGETISLLVDYFGSMDLYWNDSSDELVGLGGLKMLATIKDKNGVICGQKELDLPDISDSGRNNQTIDVVLEKKCENSSYSVSVSSNNEKLAEEMAEVPKTAETKTNKIYYYAGALILFLALLVMAIKRRNKAIISAVVFFSAFAVFGLFSNSASASATKTYDKGSAYSSGYGGYDEEKSAPLYSFYGVNDTTNINKLVIDDVYANIDSNLEGFHVDIYYDAGFTSCSNSTMQIRFKMYVEADGIKTPVNFAPWGSEIYESKQIVEFTSKTYGDRDDFFDIDPASLKNFYKGDSAKELKTNPRLIIEIVQSGKSTHTNPYHRGDFSKPVSTVDFASRSAAFDASDTIKYVIPLNLPKPSVNLTATPANVTPPNDNVSVKLDTTDMTNCLFSYKGSPAFDSLTFAAPLENGAKSQEKTISRVWSPSVSTAVQKSELTMDCTRDLGSSIGKGSYSAKATVDVNSPNYSVTISESPFSSSGTSGTVTVGFIWPTAITYSGDKNEVETGSKMMALASVVKKIFNRAEAFSRDSSKDLAVSASITCSSFPCPILAPEGATVTLTAIPDSSSSFSSWDLTSSVVCNNGPTSNPCMFIMPAKNVVAGFKLVTSVISGECSLTINKDATGGNGSVNVARSAGSSFVCNLQSGFSSCNSNSESLGDTLTLTPNPSIGATWPSGCSSQSGGSCVVNIPSSGTCDKNVTVKFPAGQQTLTVEIYGEKWTDGSNIAGGSVTGTNDFSCVGNKTTDFSTAVGGDKLLQTCTKDYTKNTNVDLYASPATGCPASGCGLKKWDGACSGGNCSFTMNTNKSVKAYFKVTSGGITSGGAVNGACGTAVNTGWASAPSGNLCSDGTASVITGGGSVSTPWAWTCNGSNGGTNAPCSASYDAGVANLTVIQTGSGSGSVSLKHMGSLDGNDGGLDSNISGSSPWGLAKDWIFQITATPSSGSSLGGVSGGGCGNSPCTITMDNDKTVTVTFNSDTSCCGGGAVTASISARNNPVSPDQSTTIDWGSANATSCAQSDGGNDSAQWENEDDTTSGSHETTAFTTTEGSRTYTIECTNGSQSDSASITIDVGNSFGVSSVDIWPEDSEVKNKGTTMIKWSSSNVSGDCLLYSATDTLGGYLDLLTTNYFGYGNYKTVPQNNTVGKMTGNLSSDTVYKIACHKESNYSERVIDQTTVTVAAPVSDFTFTNSTGAMTATIVEGLSANSSFITAELSGSAIGNINLSAKVPAILSGAKAQFSSDNGVTWNDGLSVDIGVISQVKIKTINIPGTTATGTYNVTLTAKDIGVGGISKKLNVSLQVKKVSSEWQEF